MSVQSVQFLVGGFAFSVDCVLNETHHFPSEITKYSMESGAQTSDFIFNEQPEITMHAVISNFPVVPSGAPGASFNPNALNVQTAYDALLSFRALRQIGTLVTGLSQYPNCAMADLVIPRDVATGETLEFTAQFRQINIVTSQSVTIPNARSGKIGDQSSNVNAGKQVTTPANTNPDWPNSWLYHALPLTPNGPAG